MKLIVGLGNPGKKYEQTWHNLGFLAVEKFRQDMALPAFKLQEKFEAEIAEGKLNNEKIILAKPQTYMNNSGAAVFKLAKYYKIAPEDILVVHDDVDLSLGKIRIVFDSSAGGHNGIKSIIESMSTKKFARIKIGVKTERMSVVGTADYVLEKISKEVEMPLEKSVTVLKELMTDQSLDKLQNIFN